MYLKPRPSEEVLTIVEEAIELKNRLGNPNVIWMQLGILNEEAAKRAQEAGLKVIMDRWMMRKHKPLQHGKGYGHSKGKRLK
jgi:predicted CoA-binding protein